MKYSDELMGKFFKANNIELLPWQKELFKLLANARPEDQLAIVYPARHGRRYFLDAYKKFKKEFEGEIEND